MGTITYDDFRKVEMRVGRVLSAAPHEASKNPAYVLEVDFGDELGVKKTSAQLADLYEADDLVGRKVVAVTNFPPKQIADVMSEVLVLGVDDGRGGVALLQVDDEAATAAGKGDGVPLGTRVY